MRIDSDRPFQFLKRLRRRFYLADYRDAELHHRWSQPRAEGPYAEQVFDVTPNAEAITSLLIFKPDEIGDAVYALPAVAELRRAFPNARVYLLCQRLTRPLYERAQLFDEIVDIAPGTRLSRPAFSVKEALGRFSVEAFDMSVFLRTYPAYFREFRSIAAKVRVHPVDPHMRSDSVHRAHVSVWEEERVHQSLQLLQIVARVTGQSYNWDDVQFPEFVWSAEDRLAEQRTFGGKSPDRFVVVHPFVKHETRQYPLAYWVALIERLRQALDGQWVIVGGPDDPLIEGLPDVIQTQGKLSLSQTGYLLSRAAGFVGVLSGPAHWAAALGTPTVTIMSGHSLPVEWAPLGRSLVVRAEVPCAPCHQKTCPVYGLACLTELTPERISPSIEAFLATAMRQSVGIGSG